MRIFLVLAVAGLLASALSPVGADTLSSAVEAIPDAVSVGSSDRSGSIYTSSAGMTLYTTALDEAKPGVFGCTSTSPQTGGMGRSPVLRPEHRQSCVQRWPPFVAEESAIPVGLWTIVTRPNGQKQWAYNEKPVYTSSRDKASGDVNGTMGFAEQGVWRVVEVPRRFPRGIGVVFKVDGLMLADNETERLLFTRGENAALNDADWTPVLASELDTPFGEWSLVVRDDGSRQWSFREMPVYSPRDAVHLSAKVESGEWQPIVYHKARKIPAFLTMQMTVPEVGWVYADADGRTLYMFSCFDGPDQLPCDEPGDPAAHRSALCGTGEQCAREWRPVLASPDDKPVGYWSIGDVPDPPFMDAAGAYGEGVPTVRAWTFHGRPVYTFSGDKVPGEALAHGMRGTSSDFGAITVLADTFPYRP